MAFEAGRALAAVKNLVVGKDGSRRAAAPAAGLVAGGRQLERESRCEFGVVWRLRRVGLLCVNKECQGGDQRESMAQHRGIIVRFRRKLGRKFCGT